MCRTTLRASLQKFFCNNCGDVGVVLSTLIPDAPYPGDARFTFLARRLLHYLRERFSFLYAVPQTLMQELLCSRKSLFGQDLHEFELRRMQRAASGLLLKFCQVVEQEGTYLRSEGAYGTSMVSLFFPFSHGPAFNNRA